MKIAYLTSRYPSISHTFIMREIQALRDEGSEVHTFTIRPPGADELLTDVDREESIQTFAVLPVSPLRLLWSHVMMLVAAPKAYLGALFKALRCRPPGLRAAVWHLFYFAESGVLAAEFRRRGIGHVHAHFANVASNVAMLASHMVGGSWSITLHGLCDFGDPGSVCLRTKIHDAALVICVSDFGRASAMLHSRPEYWSKIHRIRCGVQAEVYTPPTEPRPDDPGTVHILSVARMGPEKGHVTLLHAIQSAVQQGLELRCTLVGDGPLRAQLEQLAQELDIVNEVTFTGAVGQSDILRYYHDADMFVLPSFAEGLPVVLMEAMATELPVIATWIMGIPELVEQGTNGLLVPPGRIEQLAGAIIELARDPDKRRRFGARGREKVCRDYEVRENVRGLQALFTATPKTSSRVVARASPMPATSTACPRATIALHERNTDAPT